MDLRVYSSFHTYFSLRWILLLINFNFMLFYIKIVNYQFFKLYKKIMINVIKSCKSSGYRKTSYNHIIKWAIA